MTRAKKIVFEARRCFNCLEKHVVKDCVKTGTIPETEKKKGSVPAPDTLKFADSALNLLHGLYCSHELRSYPVIQN